MREERKTNLGIKSKRPKSPPHPRATHSPQPLLLRFLTSFSIPTVTSSFIPKSTPLPPSSMIRPYPLRRTRRPLMEASSFEEDMNHTPQVQQISISPNEHR